MQELVYTLALLAPISALPLSAIPLLRNMLYLWNWWRAVSPLEIRSAQVGLLASGKAGGVCLHVLLGMGHMHQR